MNQNEVNSYREQDILRLARRYQNTKRAYLLVNPLQAKHIPASPSAALTMMETLGSCVRKISSSSRLVIGFSETATAIGAACAKALGTNCFYLQTTREPLPEVTDWIVFSEEHSHATQQKLCSEHLAARLAASQGLVFVDDELSTGKTVRNLVARLRSAFPTLKLPMTAASLINRMDAVNAAQMAAEGITTVSLLTLPATDYAAQIKAMKKIAGPIRVELAQYRELASFAQFGSELDEATKNQLAQGERIREILKQPNYKPMAVEYQIIIIFAATKKLLLDVPTDKVLEFQDKLFRFVESKHPEIAAEIRDKKEISEDLAKRLTDVINECKKA